MLRSEPDQPHAYEWSRNFASIQTDQPHAEIRTRRIKNMLVQCTHRRGDLLRRGGGEGERLLIGDGGLRRGGSGDPAPHFAGGESRRRRGGGESALRFGGGGRDESVLWFAGGDCFRGGGDGAFL
jgi:hypothetical protein